MSLIRDFVLTVAIVTCAVVLLACDDDSDTSPAYQLALVDFETDSNGSAKTMITDDNRHYTVVNPVNGLKADTTYRYATFYTEENTTDVRLATASPALCDSPRAFDKEATVHTSPVNLVAIWRGSHYVNLTLHILRKDKVHTFGFIDRGISTGQSGCQFLNIELYHDEAGDIPAFTSQVYASFNLMPYYSKLTAGHDSIRFTINQYDKGSTSYALPF